MSAPDCTIRSALTVLGPAFIKSRLAENYLTLFQHACEKENAEQKQEAFDSNFRG
jgi:hypothetical protein